MEDEDTDQMNITNRMDTDEEDATTETHTDRLLLEDNFNFLNESLWKREIKMPIEPVSVSSICSFCLMTLKERKFNKTRC